MKIPNGNEYFESKSYLTFIYKKIKRGDAWKFTERLFKSINRYTLITKIIRVTGFIITIIEKSAVLLFFATVLIIALPISFLSLLLYSIICIAKILFNYKQIKKYLCKKKNITVIITKMNILSKSGNNLINRYIKNLASENDSTVVLVCGDRFVAVKWYTKNILALKEYCFFILRRFCIEKNRLNVTYIVL